LSEYSRWLEETAEQADALFTTAENEEIHHDAKYRATYAAIAGLCERILKRKVEYDDAISKRS